MNQGVMFWLVLVAFFSSRVHALSNFWKPVSFESRLPRIVDMDYLMAFHYPNEKELEETAFKEYPQVDRLVTSFKSNSSKNPKALKRQRVPKSVGRIWRHAHSKTEDIKSDQFGLRAYVRRCPWSKDRHSLAKRYFVAKKNLLSLPKARKIKEKACRKFFWMPWNCNCHLTNVTKRETSNMRTKLSDILTRAGLKKEKEDAIKVVLPLLLPDVTDQPIKNGNPVLSWSSEKEPAFSSIISSSSGKASPRMRTFKVRGDDGIEFGFSASATDFQQLMDMLAKPNSSIVLEKMSLDQHRPLLQIPTERIKQLGRTKYSKAKNAVDREKDTGALQLKEIESSVFESILQLDVPYNHSTTKQPETTVDETTPANLTTAGTCS